MHTTFDYYVDEPLKTYLFEVTTLEKAHKYVIGFLKIANF
jgi:hypothetical protein